MIFVFKMMNFVFKMMNFVVKMMNFVVKMMNFVVKMMNFEAYIYRTSSSSSRVIKPVACKIHHLKYTIPRF